MPDWIKWLAWHRRTPARIPWDLLTGVIYARMQLCGLHWIEPNTAKEMSDENRDSQVEGLDNGEDLGEQMGRTIISM